jgi:hypothetical protein
VYVRMVFNASETHVISEVGCLTCRFETSGSVYVLALLTYKISLADAGRKWAIITPSHRFGPLLKYVTYVLSMCKCCETAAKFRFLVKVVR